jgi:competence protein ComEC
MSQSAASIALLAYILGLIMTAVPWGGWGLLGIGAIAAITIPRFWRSGPQAGMWIVAGIIGCLASFYYQFRVPQPSLDDISRFVATAHSPTIEQVVTVRGQVISSPRLNRSQKVQFELATTEFIDADRQSQKVSGKLYVTVPLLQGTGLHAGQIIPVTGKLYAPKPATNPGGFDFADYLQKRGIFAGMSGRYIQWDAVTADRSWGLWTIRQRITRSLARWLTSPVSELVGAMVLGQQAVDLPYDVRDIFIAVGLAHALAASGTQVALIAGSILVLTQRLPDWMKFGIGAFTLIIYAGLTGFQPSILRATLMGLAGLIGLVLQRKIRPFGVLLLAAFLLLLYNPLWIWDLGFQLSFLATLGLIVTAQPLTQWLDWMPLPIASGIAVSIAATIWTLPLQLYNFSATSTYSLLVNLLTSPLIFVITIFGFISAIAGFIYPIAGSALAAVLAYPAAAFIAIAHFFATLPGNKVSVGSISTWQLLALYGLIGFSWLYYTRKSSQKRDRTSNKLSPIFGILIPFAIALGAIVIPAWQFRANLLQVTVLDSGSDPVLAIQDRWHVTLINAGKPDLAQFSILPFLQRQGVNRIDEALTTNLAPEFNQGWITLINNLPIRTLNYDATLDAQINALAPIIEVLHQKHVAISPLASTQVQTVGNLSFQLLADNLPAWTFQIGDRTWLAIDKLDAKQQNQLAKIEILSNVNVLCWSGKALTSELLQHLKPEVAIAVSTSVDERTLKQLQAQKTQVYWTQRDGAIQWTPEHQFKPTLDAIESDRPFG